VDALNDRALLRRYASARDLAAFDALVDRHQGLLLRLAHALLGDASTAQDAVQEGFMRLCQETPALLRDQARANESLAAWLCTVVRNHCIDLLRRRAHQRMMRLHDHLQQGGTLDEPREPAAGGGSALEHEGLWSAVASLPALERAAVVLRYRDTLSYQDIAGQLGKTVSHVGVLLHTALGRLRQSLVLKAERS
jgi:RNA polymerase sigma factor (sigma-70 family)